MSVIENSVSKIARIMKNNRRTWTVDVDTDADGGLTHTRIWKQYNGGCTTTLRLESARDDEEGPWHITPYSASMDVTYKYEDGGLETLAKAWLENDVWHTVIWDAEEEELHITRFQDLRQLFSVVATNANLEMESDPLRSYKDYAR